MTEQAVKHRWREYKTPSGNSPVRKLLMALDPAARIEVAAAMKDVRENDLAMGAMGKHLTVPYGLLQTIVEGRGDRVRHLRDGEAPEQRAG
ncbi:MAG: hypothetical protein ACI9VR_001442 [Cognaticolwellia sp.]|jgi:hypothetical protein